MVGSQVRLKEEKQEEKTSEIQWDRNSGIYHNQSDGKLESCKGSSDRYR
jgi:hypothetical protein